MNRRVGLRARTDFAVVARDGILAARCRGIEVSSGGIVLDRGRPVLSCHERIIMPLEMQLPERHKPLFALARPVWSFGTHQAMKFVRISDVDRLTLAEHLDLLSMRGVGLC